MQPLPHKAGVSGGVCINTLLIESHPDDCEAAMGGTWLVHKERGDKVTLIVCTECEDVSPGVIKEQEKAHEILQPDEIIRLYLQNTGLSKWEYRATVRHALEKLRYTTDRVYTHWLQDIHQDHRAVAEETIRVFRYNTVLQYCVPHSCPGFTANYYQPLTNDQARKKILALSRFQSQQFRPGFNSPSIAAEMIAAGLHADCQFAEAFSVWKYINNQ